MSLLNYLLSSNLKRRFSKFYFDSENPLESQNNTLMNLLSKAKNTLYGKKYSFKDITSIEKFASRIPPLTYEEFFPIISKMVQGETNISWPGKLKWFAKSSGTTNDKSKFIPVSYEALSFNHFKAGKDLLSIYLNNHPDSKIFTGKSLSIGGSRQISPLDNNIFTGDISAVLIKNLPIWARFFRTPSMKVALMSEWENKIQKMAMITSKQNVTSISGVPTWTIVLIKRILKLNKCENILELWPNLELFIHGAVSFKPYKELFDSLVPANQLNYLETYNASEGFFAFQDKKNSDEMLLLLNHGIYYEFEDIANKNKILSLDKVEINKNYALIISTNSGLWRYKIGDTIVFSSLNPYRIRISGRTKQFINAFGEELIVENAENAISKACSLTGSKVFNFTAGPKYISGTSKGCHEWIIEFNQTPKNISYFNDVLDKSLKNLNSDYEAKRYKDIALGPPIIHSVRSGVFDKWLKKKNKLGGQNKIPRLANNRNYLDDILSAI